MNFSQMFFSFDGRLNRARWWLASIILAVVAIVLLLLAFMMLGVSWTMARATSSGGLATLVVTAIIAYPATAIMVKRLNDRDRPSWMAAVFWAPSVLSILGGLFGLTETMGQMGGMQVPVPTTLGWIINIAGMIIGIWALIELGILRGTAGPNQHGPDPLA